MAEKAFFLSDLHLGSPREPKSLLLLEFLRSFQSTDEITHLFLVGDIFDLWIAKYSYFRLKYSLINREIERLVKLGVQVHYFEGNHDLYLKHYFAKKLGVMVHEGPRIFNIAGMRIRVEHGDEMDPTDRGYLLLRKILRSGFMKWLALRLPEKFVVFLGQKMSKASRIYTSHLKPISTKRARKVIREHAEDLLDSGEDFDLLIAGHVHVVEDIEIRNTKARKLQMARVINLGAWFDGARVFMLESNGSGRFLDLN